MSLTQDHHQGCSVGNRACARRSFPSLATALERDRLVADGYARDGTLHVADVPHDAPFLVEQLDRLPPAWTRRALGLATRDAHARPYRALAALLEHVPDWPRLWAELRPEVSGEERLGAPEVARALSLRDRLFWGIGRAILSCSSDHDGVRHESAESPVHVVHLVLDELASLRAARVAVAARRFQLDHGRWPVTHARALGRDPLPDETDPYVGRPFALREVNGGLAIEVPDQGPRLLTWWHGTYLPPP